MSISSIVLYFDDLPVAYEVHQMNGFYLFKLPALSSSKNLFSDFKVYDGKDGLQVEGLHNADVIKQIHRIIGVYPLNFF